MLLKGRSSILVSARGEALHRVEDRLMALATHQRVDAQAHSIHVRGVVELHGNRPAGP